MQLINISVLTRLLINSDIKITGELAKHYVVETYGKFPTDDDADVVADIFRDKIIGWKAAELCFEHRLSKSVTETLTKVISALNELVDSRIDESTMVKRYKKHRNDYSDITGQTVGIVVYNNLLRGTK